MASLYGLILELFIFWVEMVAGDHRFDEYTSINQGADDFSTEKHSLTDKEELVEVKEGQSSAVRAGANMTKSFIGAASFELPWAFMQAGLLGGIVGLMFLAVVTNYTIKLLSKCRQMTKSPETSTYIDVGRESFGLVGVILVYVSVISMNLGVCSSYVDFIASNLSLVLIDVTGNDAFNSWICILIVFPILLCLSMIRSYHFLLYTSVPGCLALLFAMAVSYGYFFDEYDLKPLSYYPMINWETYPLFFGNAAFLFCIHSVVLPIEQSMKEKSQFSRTTDVSMIIVTLLNLSFAVICYMLLGYCTQGSVTANLPSGWLPDLVEVLLCIDLLFTYTIFMIPLSEMLERLLRITPDRPLWRVKYMSLRCGLVVFTICFALLVPEFNYITNLVGGVANNLVAIILPPIFFLALKKKSGEEVKWWMYAGNITVVVVGILAGLATTVATITEILGDGFSVGLVIEGGEVPEDCNAAAYYDYSPAWL